jgi:hypothetical protein
MLASTILWVRGLVAAAIAVLSRADSGRVGGDVSSGLLRSLCNDGRSGLGGCNGLLSSGNAGLVRSTGGAMYM